MRSVAWFLAWRSASSQVVPIPSVITVSADRATDGASVKTASNAPWARILLIIICSPGLLLENCLCYYGTKLETISVSKMWDDLGLLVQEVNMEHEVAIVQMYQYYIANKQTLPSNISSQREFILGKLMQGLDPEVVFQQATTNAILIAPPAWPKSRKSKKTSQKV